LSKRRGCDDALCRYLQNFVGRNVTLRTTSGDVLTGVLKEIKDSCLIKLVEPPTMSPFIDTTLTVVRCEEVESFSVEV